MEPGRRLVTVGTTTAPPFGWAAFHVGERADLAARYPGRPRSDRAADRPHRLSSHRPRAERPAAAG